MDNLTNSLKININMFKEILDNDETIVYREFENKYERAMKCCLVFIKGMVNKDMVNEHIIQPIMNVDMSSVNYKEAITVKNITDVLIKKIVISGNMQNTSKINDLILALLYGDTILLVEGSSEGIIIETKGWEVRSVSEPDSERVVRGPKEGFTESIITNISLIRKRIRSSDLKFMFQEVGTLTKTKICICYIENIANPKIVEEVLNRLKKVDNDQILYSEMLEEFIKDSSFSLFKTIGNTERPDVASAKLMEGRIAIIIDGTPFVLTMPFIFQEYFQAADDYANNYIFASFNRMLRMTAFFLGLSVPALYNAVITYHQELIPTALLLSISTAREGIPFPTVFEALVMLTGFEMLREAGVRLPMPIGQSVSIVGALVLGEAAVNARIISAPMVIVVAVTGICAFLIPKLIGPFIIIRFTFLILSAMWGLFGYMYGVIGLFIYLFSLRSFGIPYMLYSSVISEEEIRDTAVRFPIWKVNNRPKLISKHKKRQ